MNELIEKIKQFLTDNSQDGVDFSIWLEDYLYEHYPEMLEEAPEATRILNDALPEICSEVEQGSDMNEFREKINGELERAMKHYKE